MSRTSNLHKKTTLKTLNIAVLTVSTSKYKESLMKMKVKDVSGNTIKELVEQAGHKVIEKKLLPDDLKRIKNFVKQTLGRDAVDAVIATGGTGISKLDVTIEAVEGLLDKRLPGFGEVFRRISYDAIGSPAVMTRALAGVWRGKAVFLLPGSPNAVEIAVEKLILPEIGHIVKHARGM